MQYRQSDVLIIGSGAAGMATALSLGTDLKITILTKDGIQSGATYWAQGGIAAAMDRADIKSHGLDTRIAGAGLCNEDTVDFVVQRGYESVQWLSQLGVSFTKDESCPDIYHLTQEGGHSQRRIVHVADTTGRAVAEALYQQITRRDQITVLNSLIAIDLLVDVTEDKGVESASRCYGALVFNRKDQIFEKLFAPVVVLATGGHTGIYQHTTSRFPSIGDGMAMAWRAGCRLANLEFNQFHPTKLYHPQTSNFLISEALRGEGGRLLLPDGTAFMQRFDSRKELAPRDIVARAIDHEMKRLQLECVYLDISDRESSFLKKNFSGIYQHCLSIDLDITSQAIPVVPAAHYSCGGIQTDHFAKTSVEGLFAVGEVSCTGLHGANRLASNSLLECFVFGRSAASKIRENFNNNCFNVLTNESEKISRYILKKSDQDNRYAEALMYEVRKVMSEKVGIVRNNQQLDQAMTALYFIKAKVSERWNENTFFIQLNSLRNLILMVELTIRCASERKESRGLHYTKSFPNTKNIAESTVLSAVAK